MGRGGLGKKPLVVVRRGLAKGREIPIRCSRDRKESALAAFCHPKLVKSILTPSQLLSRTIPTSRADAIPAFARLNFLEDRWMGLALPWGREGSVGFELASGRHAAKQQSDLDIVIYAERPMASDEATSLCDCTMNLPCSRGYSSGDSCMWLLPKGVR